MRFYGGAQDDWARAIIHSPDGKYILVGGTSSYGAGSSDVYLLKVDQNLNLENKTTVGTTRDDWANDIKPTADFGYNNWLYKYRPLSGKICWLSSGV